MPVPDLHVIGIDPGKVTGIARITVPRENFYEDAWRPARERDPILSWETRTVHGPESAQVWSICRYIRETQSLAYKQGPGVVVEGFDYGAPFRDEEVYSPVRIGAMLKFCKEQTALMNDAILSFIPRTLPKSAYTDDRLRSIGMWVRGPDHERDALRIALTALRRATQRERHRVTLWGSLCDQQ